MRALLLTILMFLATTFQISRVYASYNYKVSSNVSKAVDNLGSSILKNAYEVRDQLNTIRELREVRDNVVDFLRNSGVVSSESTRI